MLQSLEKSGGKAGLISRMSKMGQAIIASPQSSVEDHETNENVVDEDAAKGTVRNICSFYR